MPSNNLWKYLLWKRTGDESARLMERESVYSRRGSREYCRVINNERFEKYVSDS